MENLFPLQGSGQSAIGQEVPANLANLTPTEIFKCAISGSIECADVIHMMLFQKALRTNTPEGDKAKDFFFQARSDGFDILVSDIGIVILQLPGAVS